MSHKKLTAIYLYPIKSLAGISLNNTKIFNTGLEFDRNWMIIDEEKKFVTQRTHPILGAIIPTIEGSKIQLTHNNSRVEYDINQTQPTTFSTKVWNDSVDVSPVSNEVDAWLSNIIKEKCTLVKINGKRANSNNNELSLTLTDQHPLLIIGSASLKDASVKTGDDLDIRRFRPNFVIETETPYEEDHWKKFTIGSSTFTGIQRCGRCMMINVNPSTFTPDKELLKQLSEFRKLDHKIAFGLHATGYEGGNVSIGDRVVVF